ncbi:ABC transporter ATP-binding protein [Nitrosomonas marina]|uniref:Putative ABC transport system ATP-binding protein n=1 Tax=Nitrosomonas marina TaxID=917 RepID=A0A1H8DBU1_9PROT|nr:ABC transporter ATP-binding protein [Nitrosomonas marina]SEN04719.1 putative ABC transport system ATP-binding protein [Nitrosomonas marina]
MPLDAIKIKNLCFSYPGISQTFWLEIPEWRIAQGERIFLKGASGSGKSTLLNLLSGILVATHGTIEILGQDLCVLSARQRDRFRAAHIGIVFQQFNLVPYLSVYDNIRLAAYFGRKKQDDLDITIKQLFTVLNLDDALIMRKAGNLSVGQQQRVAIARALVNRPEILVVDEPTSALDNDLRDAFMDMLLEICRVHASTLIFVSHDATLTRFFDTIVNMSDINQAGAKTNVF